MKKIFLLSLASLMFACTPVVEYTINGETDEELEGKEVYLKNVSSNKVLDTTVVKDGKFSFSGTINGELENIMAIGQIKIEKSGVMIVLEEGDIAVKINGQVGEVSGTPNNETLNTLTVTGRKLYSDVVEARIKLSAELKDDKAKLNATLGELYTKYGADLGKLSDSTFKANKLNLIGAYLYPRTLESEATISDIEEFIAENPFAADEAPITKALDGKKALINTAVGKMFTDFTVRNGDNTADAKLSDYVGKGNYVLVDFWASWCGPCIGEIPNLRKAHEEFGPKGLVVLGINVWDDHAKGLKVIEDHKMDWAHIYAPRENTDATTIYGIRGIPSIMLFAPDGTIVDRTIRGQKILDKLAEVYNQ